MLQNASDVLGITVFELANTFFKLCSILKLEADPRVIRYDSTSY